MTSSTWTRLSLLWFTGISLRMTVLAIPPILTRIHHDLHLNEKLVGVLTALPILLIAAAAVLGSLLVARMGPRRALTLGLFLVAAGGAARGAGGSAVALFAMTFVMGVGIAIAQPTLPALSRQWFPLRSALATAVYSNGFLIGEIVAVSFTVPLLLPLLGGDWRLVLVVWSLPVLATALAIPAGTPHVPREIGAEILGWWPDWQNATTWQLGLILGCASIAYFCSNAFIPDFLKASHHGQYVTATLTSLNLAQLPASLLVAALPHLFVRRRWPIVVTGALTLVSALGLALSGPAIIIMAALLGFCTALIFVLCLALPPVLGNEQTVHRLSAAMFAIAYTCSFSGTLVGGGIWDATGIPFSAFAPVIVAGPAMMLLTMGLNLHPGVPTPTPATMTSGSRPTAKNESTP